MPHAQPRHHPLEPVRVELPMYVRDGPLRVVYYPCPCGNVACIQPVLVNNHHMQGLQIAHERLRNAGGNPENLADPLHNEIVENHNRNDPRNFFINQEQARLEYPMYPEDRPRASRRSRRRRAPKRSHSHIGVDSDNECDIDR